MKKELAYCITSLVVLLLGITCFISLVFLNDLSNSSKAALILFGICFFLIGATSYAKHNKKYLKIRYLKNENVPLIASWHFKPHTSLSIDEMYYEGKASAIYTTLLGVLLCLVVAGCIYFSGEKYAIHTSLGLLALSLIIAPLCITCISAYYTGKLESDSEALIGEDCIYFLDELYTLHKSIYFLEDIRIGYGGENSLQLLYGEYDLFTGPMYTIKIPIPDGELETAKLIQKHFIELIHYPA
jgi:energy-coupling factor transporter transmembrane protein EcfT